MRFSFKFFSLLATSTPSLSLTRGTMLFWGFTSPTLRRRIKGFDSVHQIFSKKDRAVLLFVQAELRLFAFSGERERECGQHEESIIPADCRWKWVTTPYRRTRWKRIKASFFGTLRWTLLLLENEMKKERKREKELVSYKGSWRMNWDEKIEELGSSWKVHCIRSDKSANDLVKTWIGEARLSSGAYWLLLEELYWL